MVELSTREHALNLVAKNPEWNVLDLGCGTDGIKTALEGLPKFDFDSFKNESEKDLEKLEEDLDDKQDKQ